MRLHASTCRRIAREVLSGQWLSAIATGFIASVLGVFTNLITGVLKLMILTVIMLEICEAIPHYALLTFLVIFLIAFLWTFIGPYVRIGYLDYNLSLLDQRAGHGPGLFGASASWWESFEINLSILVRSVICGILFIIPGIVTYYSYAMAPFLLEERANMTVSDAMTLSRQLMKGHRFEFFCLRMSFLGWKVLGFLTLGIAFLWINPYYALSETVFFNEVSGRAEALYDRHDSRKVANNLPVSFDDFNSFEDMGASDDFNSYNDSNSLDNFDSFTGGNTSDDFDSFDDF